MSLPPFTLPSSLEIDVSGESGISLRYGGDVVLEQTFNRPIAAIQVGGNLDLAIPMVNGTCVAQGSLTVHGDVNAVRLTGKEVHLHGRRIEARAISASERIVIGPCELDVDVIIAPVIQLHPDVSGRVTILESRNRRGPSQITGARSMGEFEAAHGGAIGFLSERGVGPIDPDVDIDELLSRPRAIVSDGATDTALDLEEFVDSLDLADDDDFLTDDPPTGEVAQSLLEGSITGAHEMQDGLQIVAMNDDDDDDLIDWDAPTEMVSRDELLDDSSDEDLDDLTSNYGTPLPPRAPTPAFAPARTMTQRPDDAGFAALFDAVKELRGVLNDPTILEDLSAAVSAKDIENARLTLDRAWEATYMQARSSKSQIPPRISARFCSLSDKVDALQNLP